KSGNDANTSQVKVTRIEVEGNTIPTASYVFPDEAIYKEDGYNQNVTSQKYNSATTYVSDALKLASVENKDIKEVDNPESFIKKNQSAQEYLDAFNKEGIKSHDLCYLRETNKAIKGTIWYSLDGGTTEKHVTFNITSEGNAIRNRELVVYGYFLNGQMGKLTVTPSIQEWQDGGTFDFIDASTNV
ncbi:surface protein, partial [human gut metagenome]